MSSLLQDEEMEVVVVGGEAILDGEDLEREA